MDILQSAGSGKTTKKTKKQEIQNKNKQKTGQLMKTNIKIPPIEKLNIKPVTDDQEDEEKEEIVAAAELDMLDSLTGTPHPDDEILFAIPVVAPYNTLNTYK